MGIFDLAKRAVRRLLQGRRSLPRHPMPPPAPPVAPPLPPRLPPPPPPAGQSPPAGSPPAAPTDGQPPPPTRAELRDIQAVDEVYDDIQLLGRDRSYVEAGAVDQLMTKMRRVKSSNVWGYYFEIEGNPHTGLLYVTFLADSPPGGGDRPQAPGSTYVYFDVPTKKYREFARASDSSAGRAVWDYLRVRGTVWQHQHRYRFLQNQGEYVPRKATRKGFQSRTHHNPLADKIPNATWSALQRLEKSPNPQVREYGRRKRRELMQLAGHRRSTLAPRLFMASASGGSGSAGQPNRGGPNRGSPNRGGPNRG